MESRWYVDTLQCASSSCLESQQLRTAVKGECMDCKEQDLLVQDAYSLPCAYNIFWLWARSLLQSALQSDVKVVVMVRCILPSRLLCVAMKGLVADIDIFKLFQQTVLDPYKTVDFHNKRFQLSEGCVNVAVAMRRLRRSYEKP